MCTTHTASAAQARRQVGRSVGLPARLALVVIAALLPSLADAAPAAWRITHELPAPWAAPGQAAAPASLSLAGQTLALRSSALQGPAPLRCVQARTQHLPLLADGLFEGQLARAGDTPAATDVADFADSAARALGISTLPAPALRITCSHAGFDFVQANSSTWLLALDQRIWVLSAAPGALAPAASPAGVVQRLLERHFAGPSADPSAAANPVHQASESSVPAFTPALMGRLQPYTSTALQAAAAAWFTRAADPNEAPELNGDPFTDSQEALLHFAVGTAAVKGDRAQVPVVLADGTRRWTLHYQLRRTAQGWRVDDVRLRDGARLRQLLQEAQR